MNTEMKSELKFMKNDDIDKYNPKDFENCNHIHIDTSQTKIDDSKFLEVFDRMANVKLSRKFHLDLDGVELNQLKVDKIRKCFENFSNLTNLHLHCTDMKIDDTLFESLLNQGICKLQNLDKLHLKLQNANWSINKKNSVENLIKSLPKLTKIRLDLQRNNITKGDIESLRELIQSKTLKELLI